MDRVDLERIARLALKELGASSATLTIEPMRSHPDAWRIDVAGSCPARLTIKCGDGSTAQWVRAQIFEQFLAQT